MDLTFSFIVRNARDYIKPHAHPALEIVYYTDGSGLSALSGINYPVHRNTFTITRAGELHDQENHAPLTSICLGLLKSGLERFQGRYADEGALLRRPLERLLEEIEHREPGADWVIRGLLLEINGLVRRIAAGQASRPVPAKQRTVRKALSIIKERNGRVSLEELSGELYISKDYLRHLFQEETRQSPVRHIISARIEKAKDLLAKPGMTVKESAAAAGFEDVYYFSRLFKKVTRHTPTEYQSMAAGKSS